MNKNRVKNISSQRFGPIWLVMILIFSLLISQLGFFQVDVVYAITTRFVRVAFPGFVIHKLICNQDYLLWT